VESRSNPKQYRPDVDGLRAVAILSVVAFHAWPALAPGGFVGVDIFFVISGFLITRIVLARDFTFANFYQRRIRRIFPALLVVLAATLPLGQVLLPPDGFRSLLQHAIGGGLFVANFLSYANDGYFSGASDLKPLLHLWSLGVEEQFYLLWPFMARVAMQRGRLARFVTLLATVSFALFLWLTRVDPRAAFFLAPSRFWELLAGAALVGVAMPTRWASLASAAGLAMIAASVAFMGSDTEFPGASLLVPVCGAALLIASPTSRVASHILSSRAAVWVGLISYPLYLWHWPLLSLLRNFGRSPSSLAIGAVVVGSFVLAEGTRRLVERPLVFFRLEKVAAALAAFMVAAVGLTSATYASTESDAHELTNQACTNRYPYRPPSLWFCSLSRDADPTVLLLGDSHANHLYDGLVQTLPDETILSIGACVPTIGLFFPAKDGTESTCVNEHFAEQSSYLNRYVIGAPTLRQVVVSAMWPAFDDAGNEIDYWTGKVVSRFGPVDGTPLQAYIGALERQLDRLGNMPTTFVLDTPRRGLAVDVQMQRQAAFRREIATLAARHPNMRVFDPMPVMCGASWCRWNLLRDANHLSRQGSVTIADAMTNRAP
jgi:peptidoglycan/LPS O-acetylase OafA/YrhL